MVAMPHKKSLPDHAAPAPLLDTSYLEGLLGYNCRRAALSIIEVFLPQMAVYGLRPVDFSVLCVIAHNPGATSRQLCAALGILPPNFVTMLAVLEKRGLVRRQPHPDDRRAVALSLTEEGLDLVSKAEVTAQTLEDEAAAGLNLQERHILGNLLRKIYQRSPKS
jgi:DNA-binding MarR family transcriptional regulator